MELAITILSSIVSFFLGFTVCFVIFWKLGKIINTYGSRVLRNSNLDGQTDNRSPDSNDELPTSEEPIGSERKSTQDPTG